MKVLFDQLQIEVAIKRMASQIDREHYKSPHPVLFICVLNGGFMVFSELVRNLTIPIQCDFLRVKSYQGSTQGEIVLTKDVELDVEGKHVYVVDDIYDTGNTVRWISQHLHSKGDMESLNVVTLLKRRHSTYSADTTNTTSLTYAFDIDDEWVWGYGCDREDGTGRNLKGIVAQTT